MFSQRLAGLSELDEERFLNISSDITLLNADFETLHNLCVAVDIVQSLWAILFEPNLLDHFVKCSRLNIIKLRHTEFLNQTEKRQRRMFTHLNGIHSEIF